MDVKVTTQDLQANSKIVEKIKSSFDTLKIEHHSINFRFVLNKFIEQEPKCFVRDQKTQKTLNDTLDLTELNKTEFKTKIKESVAFSWAKYEQSKINKSINFRFVLERFNTKSALTSPMQLNESRKQIQVNELLQNSTSNLKAIQDLYTFNNSCVNFRFILGKFIQKSILNNTCMLVPRNDSNMKIELSKQERPSPKFSIEYYESLYKNESCINLRFLIQILRKNGSNSNRFCPVVSKNEPLIYTIIDKQQNLTNDSALIRDIYTLNNSCINLGYLIKKFRSKCELCNQKTIRNLTHVLVESPVEISSVNYSNFINETKTKPFEFDSVNNYKNRSINLRHVLKQLNRNKKLKFFKLKVIAKKSNSTNLNIKTNEAKNNLTNELNLKDVNIKAKEKIIKEVKKEPLKPKIIAEPVKCTKKIQTDCYDYYKIGYIKNVILPIKPKTKPDCETIKVSCDMRNGGYTLIMKRFNGEVDFFRNWIEYKNGFGEVNKEFWIG